MNCAEARDLLAELATDELDELRAARVKAHLATCAECRAEAAALRDVVGMLAEDAGEGELGGVADPGERYWANFAGRVRTKLAGRDRAAAPASRGVFAWLRAPRLALAAAVALLAWMAVRLPGLGLVGEDDEATLAALVRPDPAAIPEALSQLSPEEAALVEQRLLAERPRTAKTAAPAPTPVPAASPAKTDKKRAPVNGAGFDTAASPRGLQDDISDLDELSPEELDRLLEKLDAMKT